MQRKTLFLIPVDLGQESSGDWIGPRLRSSVLQLRRFVVEHPKSARRFLKGLGLPLQELEFEVLDEHSKPDDLDRLAHWLEKGGDTGLLSEAGCPAVADPGAALVGRAHRLGMQVVPLVGPSSIVLALMASGMNGQRFAFNGYLPQTAEERNAHIRALEKRSRNFDQTEIFIEAPYRNDQLFKAVIGNCSPGTMLGLASELTGAGEEVRTKSVAEWRRGPPPRLHKRPTVFLLMSGAAESTNRQGGSGNPH
jgi:16S rRNA (cytidine1402-2'-O)-methyltransferase